MEGNMGEAVVEKMEMAPPVARKAPKKKGPKKMTGYQLFLKACLDEMRARYPDSSILLSSVPKLCSENWKKMGEEMRQRFHQHAAAVNSANSQDEEIPIPINGKVSKPKVFHMRKPLTAFKIYCSERRQGIKRSHPEFSNAEIKRMLSDMWVTTDTATKLNCEKRSRRQFERYYEERFAAKIAMELTGKPEEEVTDTDEKIEEELEEMKG